jgi:hypothetical protein
LAHGSGRARDWAQPVEDLEAMTASLRQLKRDRQGVPMFLVLEDLVTHGSPAAESGPADDGPELAWLASDYHIRLPDAGVDPDLDLGDPELTPREAAEWHTAAVLEVLAAGHFSGPRGKRMSSLKSQHAAADAPVNASGFGFYADHLRRGRLVRVVNFHNTAAGAATALRTHLERLNAEFSCISLSEFDGIFATGEWHGDRPPLLPVFYEGYANHASVAAPILDELGMTGWFFIPTMFIDTPVAQQREFAQSHSIGLVEEEAGAKRLAMTWDEIADLSRRHVVTPHTGTHEEIGRIISDEDLDREVFGPFRSMRQATGHPPPATAFLSGQPLGEHPPVDHAIRKTGYRYVFSNTRVQRLLT